MKYFQLWFSDDPEEIGNRDGLGHGYLDDNFYRKNKWYEDIFINTPRQSKDWWKIWSQMPAHGQDLVEIKMHSKARHSDYIDFGNFREGFIVNKRLRSILEAANLPNHKFFQASFLQRKELVTDYWWLTYDLELGASTVNFASSEFDLSWHDANFDKPFKISSYEDYLAIFYKTGRAVRATKLVFTSAFNQDLDIWGTQFLLVRKAYISERLLSEMREKGITGYRILEPDCPLIFTEDQL